MKITQEVGRILKAAGREKSPSAHSRVHTDMVRVTDYSGQEYYCHMSDLDDPNFVSESEKSKCFDYTLISTNRAL